MHALQTLWGWVLKHPEVYIPVVLGLLNLVWRSPTRVGMLLRTLGPDPIAFWRGLSAGKPDSSKKDAAPAPRKDES